MLLARLINLYSLVLAVIFVLPLFGVAPAHPVVGFCDFVTAPLLAPIRAATSPIAELDFSPLILLVGLQLFRLVLLPKGALKV